MRPVAAITMVMLCGTGFALPADADRGAIRRAEWGARDDRGGTVARALTVTQLAADVQASRMLFEAGGERFAITTVARAAKGTITSTLQNAHSGDWVELTQHYGLAAQTMAEWFRLFHEENRPADLMLELTVRTSAGTAFSLGEIPYIDAPDIEHVARSATDAQSVRALRREVSSAFPAPAISRLAAAVAADEDSAGFRDVVSLVSTFVDADRAAPELRVTARTRGKGFRLTEPADIEFASRFGSINPVNPLIDRE